MASDNRRYAAAGFPSVGVALGGSGGHTPDDWVEHVDVAAIEMAARLLLATLWNLAFWEEAILRPICASSVCIYDAVIALVSTLNFVDGYAHTVGESYSDGDLES